VQNNSILLKLVAKQRNIFGFNHELKKKNSHHLKNDSDSDKN
jgi:hypothetical protein